jgi:hypothetical protein
MRRTSTRLLAATAALTAAACTNDASLSPNSLDFGSAFNTVPAGMESVASSYAGDGQDGMAWGGPRRGGMGGPGMSGLMGGGLADGFGGGMGGRGPHDGPFGGVRIDDSCPVSGNDITCTTTRNGLTIKTIYNLSTAAGAAQTKLDTITTNTVRSRTTVTGTTTRGRDNASVTATVNNSSERTVSGLAKGSTQRTVEGWSTATENASGTNRDGQKFTSVRVAGDTTRGLKIPVSTTTTTYPTAGTVTRAMKVTTTITGAAPVTKTRREVLTYDGSATAKLVITEDGTTRNCTVALPRGRPSCS